MGVGRWKIVRVCVCGCVRSKKAFNFNLFFKSPPTPLNGPTPFFWWECKWWAFVVPKTSPFNNTNYDMYIYNIPQPHLLYLFFFFLFFFFFCEIKSPDVLNHGSPQWYDIVYFEHKLSGFCFGLPQLAGVRNHDSPQWYDIIHFEHNLSWFCFGLPQLAGVRNHDSP